MAKSGNRVKIDDYEFLSESEADFYLKIKRAKEEGRIKDFDVAPHYLLQQNFIDWRGNKVESIDHYPDFLITRLDGSQYIIDSKGGSFHENDAKIKRKIWMYQHPEIPYYYASVAPKFLGGNWVETTTGNDFLKKLRLAYKEIHPQYKTRKITASSPQIKKSQVDEYFDWEYLDGIFYIMHKKYTKKQREKNAKEKLK